MVDGNVFRVLSRVFGMDKEINSPEGKRAFTLLANELINKNHPDIHNQAIMEFGALYCTPKNPPCDSCVFLKNCFAAQNKLQHLLPAKHKLKKPRKRYFYYLVVRKGDLLLMRQRKDKDIWHGLYDFYLVERTRPEGLKKVLKDLNSATSSTFQEEYAEFSATYKHVLTHQIIFSKFIVVNEAARFGLSDRSLTFYSAKKIAALPKPVLISRFLTNYHFL